MKAGLGPGTGGSSVSPSLLHPGCRAGEDRRLRRRVGVAWVGRPHAQVRTKCDVTDSVYMLVSRKKLP